MTRTGTDTLDALGILRHGFDYELQCWVKDYIVLNCGHPEPLNEYGTRCGCKAREYAGCRITDAREREGLNAKDQRAPVDLVTFAQQQEAGRTGVTPGPMVCSNATITGKRAKTCTECGEEVRLIEICHDDEEERKTAYNCDHCDLLIYTVRFKD